MGCPPERIALSATRTTAAAMVEAAWASKPFKAARKAAARKVDAAKLAAAVAAADIEGIWAAYGVAA